MADFTADFEAGVNGNTITTGAGEASATKFDFVTGSPIYDVAHVHSGTLAMKSVSGGDSNVGWTASASEHYGRAYLYFTSYPTTAWRILDFNTVFVQPGASDGLLTIRAGGDFDTCTTPIALNQWIRVEWHVVYHATTGVKELKLFNNAESTTPTETVGSTNIDTGTADHYSFGAANGSVGVDFWLDDIIANATSYPGPSIVSTQNFAPVIYGRGAC